MTVVWLHLMYNILITDDSRMTTLDIQYIDYWWQQYDYT